MIKAYWFEVTLYECNKQDATAYVEQRLETVVANCCFSMKVVGEMKSTVCAC